MGKISKACDISPTVRAEVMERDRGSCIVCGANHGIQIAHYVSRARLGLGIPSNLACMCYKCHFDFDNGHFHGLIKNVFREHLRAHYEGWSEEDQIYSKWRNV